MKKNTLLVLAATMMLAACGTKPTSEPKESSGETTTSETIITSEVSQSSEAKTSETPASSETSVTSETPVSSSEELPPAVLVSSIEVANIPTVMDVNQEVKLEISVLPANATDATYKITSSNKKVVDAYKGTLTAYSAGTATITIAANDESGVKKEFEVTVLDTIKAPTDWEGAKTLIQSVSEDVSTMKGYSYSYERTSFVDGNVSSKTSITKNYEYGASGNVGYKGVYEYETTEKFTTLLAGYKGINGEKYVNYEHTYSSYDYVNTSKPLADIGEEAAIKDAQKMVEIDGFIETTSTSYEWDGDTKYTASTEDGVITMVYTHQYDAKSYAKKGDFTVKVTKYGKLISATLNNYGFLDGEFQVPNYVESYELNVVDGDKPESISIAPKDFFISENHSVVVKTSGNKGDNKATVGSYLSVIGKDETKPYALDYLDGDFSIVSSSNEAVIGKKAGYKDWYALSVGTSTLTIKHKNTGKEHTVVVETLLPDATHFDTVKSSEGIQFPVGTTTEFTAVIKPNDASQEFVATSSDPTVLKIEKVDGKWIGTGLKEGNVTVTFTDPAGTAKPSTLDITVTAKEAEKAAYEGTWVSGSNTMVLNSNGNGTWNGINFTFTFNEATNKATMSNFGAFDDDENTFTYNPSTDTISVHLSGDYGDNVYNTNMSRKAEEEAKSFVGTWKSGSNTMVLQKNGNGTWNGYNLTFTYDAATGKGTMSNFAAFDDDENYFIYNEAKDTIFVHVSGDYGDNLYETTMTRS